MKKTITKTLLDYHNALINLLSKLRAAKKHAAIKETERELMKVKAALIRDEENF